MRKLSLLVFMMVMFGAMYTSQAQTIDKSFTPFDSYGRIPWKDEQVALLQLELFLRREPTMTGYIIFYWESRKDREEMRRRTRRAYDYLTKTRRLEKRRLVILDGGQIGFSWVILQPAEKSPIK